MAEAALIMLYNSASAEDKATKLCRPHELSIMSRLPHLPTEHDMLISVSVSAHLSPNRSLCAPIVYMDISDTQTAKPL